MVPRGSASEVGARTTAPVDAPSAPPREVKIEDQQERRLRRLWKRIPSTRCKGLCQESCGPISASHRERAMLERHLSPWPTLGEMAIARANDPEHYRCPLLVDGRCSAYQDRPTICRLWGAEEVMKCRWGCVPDYGWLSEEEGREIIEESLRIGGEAF